MFGSKPSQPVASTTANEFDPYAHTWKASERVVTPPPSQPNAALAAQDAAAKQENSTLNKAGRMVASTASAVGRVAKKPLEWLPFGKKDEAPVGDGKPAPQ
jgi:hypothetical protein